MEKRFCLVVPLIVLTARVLDCSLTMPPAAASSEYPVHRNITTTYFWVGEKPGPDNGYISNLQSAWDEKWMENYGGVDDPDNRNGYFPAGFTPKENPFYFALPYNDFDDRGDRKADVDRVYWWGEREWESNESCCKDQWIRIVKGTRVAYAQWEDVGPYGKDDVDYVFGASAPQEQVGLDVSPAVRDYLGLSGSDKTDWQFVDASSVPDGPWTEIVTGDQPYPNHPPESGVSEYTLYFAEGCTREGFDEWLCLMNPNPEPTTAHVTFMFTDGTTSSTDIAIEGTTRTTLKVNDIVGEGKDVSIKVTADAPILAERPMYFDYRNGWSGGHVVAGVLINH